MNYFNDEHTKAIAPELLFYKDIANWVVIRTNSLEEVLQHQARIDDYSEQSNEKYWRKHNYDNLHRENYRFVILVPDKITLVAAKHAINHADLSSNFKKRIEYGIDGNLPYCLILYDLTKKLRYFGYRQYIKNFLKDKPWIDRDIYEHELIVPTINLAKIIGYNSYLKRNTIWHLFYNSMNSSYKFKADTGSSGCSFYADSSSKNHEQAVQYCLDFLKHQTCITPMKVERYFVKEGEK